MEGRKCNTLPFAELLFLSFPSRHFHFEHPKRAFSLDGEVKKEKKKGTSGETGQYAHTNCTYAKLKPSRNLMTQSFKMACGEDLRVFGSREPCVAPTSALRPFSQSDAGLQHLVYI